MSRIAIHLMAGLMVLTLGLTSCAAEAGKDGPWPLAKQKELAEAAGLKVAAAPDAPKPGEAAPKFSAQAVKAGAAVFVRDYNLPIYPESRLTRAELEAPAVIEVCPGETEPLSLGVRALEDLKDLRVKVSDLMSKPGQPKARIRYVEAGYIRVRPRARRRRLTQTVLAPLRLRPVEPMPLAKGQNRQFWIEAVAGARVAKGTYGFLIAVHSRGRPALTRQLTVKVRPFKLAEPKRFIGAFCSVKVKPDRVTFADWKDHGVQGMLWFWSALPWEAKLVDGKLKLDFSACAEVIDEFAAAKLKGPIVIALANDRTGHYERMLCKLYDRPLAKKSAVGGKTAKVANLDDEVINAAYMEGVRQFDAFRKTKKDWPEVVILHYDEPTERMMPEATLRYKQIKQVAPDIRVYGVTMDTLSWAKQLVPISDILVCNGSYAKIAALGRKTGKAVWGYCGTTADRFVGGCRFNMGLFLWQYDLGSHWFWSYDFSPGSPWNEFDGRAGEASWVVVYPGQDRARPVPTLGWEGLREAWDDLRYAATLEKLLGERRGATRDRVAAEYAAFKKAIPKGGALRAFPVVATGPHAGLHSYHRLTAMRAKLVAWIEMLLEK